MFVGAIDSTLRSWLATNAPRWKGRTIFCGCSGNFTIEGIAAGYASRIYSNDISLYSHVLGEAMMGRRAKVGIKHAAYTWLEPYWETSQAATIILFFEALKFERRTNFHTERLWKASVARFTNGGFEKACTAVAAARDRMKLAEFTSIDIGEFLARSKAIDPTGIQLNFLPTYTAGYEKMYARLDEILDWTPPDYTLIDADRKAALVREITTEWDYVLYDDQERPDLPGVMLRDKGGSKRVWLYSNLPVTSSYVAMPFAIEPTDYARITDADVDAITPATPVAFQRVKSTQFDYFRTLYLAKNINPSGIDLPLFVFIGGKLAGFLGLSREKYGAPTAGGIFLMTDFCMPPEGSRLSKLVLRLTRTNALAELAAERFMMKIATLSTAVFTDKPVSMKYRGVYKLQRRALSKGKAMLVYQAQAATHTIPEAITEWLSSRQRSEPPSRP